MAVSRELAERKSCARKSRRKSEIEKSVLVGCECEEACFLCLVVVIAVCSAPQNHGWLHEKYIYFSHHDHEPLPLAAHHYRIDGSRADNVVAGLFAVVWAREQSGSLPNREMRSPVDQWRAHMSDQGQDESSTQREP